MAELRRHRRTLAAALACAFVLLAPWPAAANLLRNPDFQDDWTTAIPQSQTLHWSYSYDYQNRRDFNPDGWTLKGSWEWRDADAAPGGRRLAMRGPDSEIRQRVNWIAVHDDRKLEGFPDAGGFPALAEVRSRRPLALVRDLTARVRVSGRGVPAGAGSISVGYGPAGQPSPGDPFGTPSSPLVAAEAPLPTGDFEPRWVEVTLPAERWRQTVEASGNDRDGWPLPAVAQIAVRYRGAAGEIAIEQAELVAAPSAAPNLLAAGSFESAGEGGLPRGWSGPEPYRYFPPGAYYLFNTWHNGDFPSRGRPALDTLVTHDARASLRMPALAGDEIAVRSPSIALHQREPRLIEVSAWVKTRDVNQLQIDARDEHGRRLDGFDFVHKAITSIGSGDWRLVRQVFRPRAAVETLTLLLAVRGVNGSTLGGTGEVPENNAAGVVWWNDVRVGEPESTTDELAGRRVAIARVAPPPAGGVRLAALDVGEVLRGENLLSARIENGGVPATLAAELAILDPHGRERSFRAPPVKLSAGASAPLRIVYRLDDDCPAYSERRFALRLRDEAGRLVGATEIPVAGWTTPIAIELGALYLDPAARTQLVRLNLGLSALTMATVSSVRLEIVGRGDGRVVRTLDVPATAAALREVRERIPRGIRGDLRNLVLADLDVSGLPIAEFGAPERRWRVRATVRDVRGRALASAESEPFARLAHPAPQPPVREVAIRGNTVLVNGTPWIPWGATYGFTPRYAGAASVAADAAWNLHALPPWNYYDGFGSTPYTRRDNDLSSLREFPGYDPIVAPAARRRSEDAWTRDGLYTGTFFLAPSPGVFSLDALAEKAGGGAALDDVLSFASRAPMIVSTGPGFEEIFGRFHAASNDDLRALAELVEQLRRRTGKPVMVGHGGAWNRFELEKVSFFDIFDPETEPLHPASLHTGLWPLVEGRDKAIWLRPQMYESVPYERWRFHTLVELMRGARGWQMAHGPADASLFRGLHAEIEALKGAITSAQRRADVTTTPPIEHWAGRTSDATLVIAATTHALAFGGAPERTEPSSDGARRVRVSEPAAEAASEHPLDDLMTPTAARWAALGFDDLPMPRSADPGARLVQALRIDPQAPPRSLAILVETGGRWRSVAAWGALDVESLRRDLLFGAWFLRRFYRNAVGFIGYDGRGLATALAHLPERYEIVGALPEAGRWTSVEVPLSRFELAGGSIEGVGFLHDGGRVAWSDTALVAADGRRDVLWPDTAADASATRRVRIAVPGARAGQRVRVLFEDREIVAADGFFEDDFRGRDLYQRYGGANGYGSAPVAVHVYSVPAGR